MSPLYLSQTTAGSRRPHRLKLYIRHLYHHPYLEGGPDFGQINGLLTQKKQSLLDAVACVLFA